MKKVNQTPVIKVMSLAILATSPSLVYAQQAPNAGQLLQQERAAPTLPKATTPLKIMPMSSSTVLPGGAAVVVEQVQFVGNTVFTAVELQAALNLSAGKTYDMAGLTALAQQVSAFYRQQGVPFAKAYLPEQKFANGVLTIAVIEGHYGQVKANGDFAEAAQGFLAPLQIGTVIRNEGLERSTLLLNDLPGIKTSSTLRPGQAVGTGDLLVEVKRTAPWEGEVGVDNQGNRYTGEYRARLNLQANSPFMLGDQFTLKTLYSNADQWLGNLGYSLPLGNSGLRAQLAYAHTYYELGKQFSNLNATGTADVASVGLSYPIVRSQAQNLTLSVNYQNKKLLDKQGVTSTETHKRSDVVPVALAFDWRDGLGGGGVSYGSLSYSMGNLHLDASQQASDASTAKTNGSFQKWNLDFARLQATGLSNLQLFARFSAQRASKNLDSSEDFGLGGVNGVRAYPGSEGFGDQGWLGQLEARYQLASVSPYAFYDVGRSKINRNPWVSGTNERKLAGYGFGVRFNQGAWSLDASMAWRERGGRPTSDTRDDPPRFWVTAGYRF